MVRNISTTAFQNETIFQIDEQKKIIQRAQEKIYRFFLETVKNWIPDLVLREFKYLFIYHSDPANSENIQALYEIILANDEEEFRNTLKRCCYILINNWSASRNHLAIQNLVELLNHKVIHEDTSSMTLNRLRAWLRKFVISKNYEELKLFASKYDEQEERHWSERYTSFLLVPQYVNIKNSPEQREAARMRAQQIKEKYKFDLALYTARCNSVVYKDDKPKNPTGLGDEVLLLIKMIVVKRGQFSYSNIANIFLNQTQGITYKEFKKSLHRYLIFSVDNRDCVAALNLKLNKKLKPLYSDANDQILNDALLLRTCKRVVEFLTTEDRQKPSSLFILLLSQGHPLTLVIILLKIALICKPVRTHLEACLGELIQYYLNYPEDECKWVVNFLEIVKITFAIYDDKVQYNLLEIKNGNSQVASAVNMQNYRIFSQQIWNKEVESEDDSIAVAEADTLEEESELFESAEDLDLFDSEADSELFASEETIYEEMDADPFAISELQLF